MFILHFLVLSLASPFPVGLSLNSFPRFLTFTILITFKVKNEDKLQLADWEEKDRSWKRAAKDVRGERLELRSNVETFRPKRQILVFID